MRLAFIVISFVLVVLSPSQSQAQQLVPADKANSSYCRQLDPFVQQALRLVPRKHQFPCDTQHIIVIDDVDRFLNDYLIAHPELRLALATRYQAHHSLAFTIDEQFPIYINRGSHPLYFRTAEQWQAYVLASVLVHENVHASQHEKRESVALRAELECAAWFQSRGLIPLEYDLRALGKTILEALTQEKQSADLARLPRPEKFAELSLAQDIFKKDAGK